MVDVFEPRIRSKNMSRIRSKNTSPEIIIRRYLHRKGFRFRLHTTALPGTPDIILPKYQLAIFVHGCFWHRHQDCALTTTPATRHEFWTKKFESNVARDSKKNSALIDAGWRILIIWECGTKYCSDRFEEIETHIRSDLKFSSWPESPPRPAHKGSIRTEP